MSEWLDFKNYTRKHYAIIGGVILLLILLIGFIATRESKEEKVLKQAKQDLVITYSYEEDLLRPVLEEEKTVEQLVEEIVREQLGIGAAPTSFKLTGVREDIGLFAEAAVYEADHITPFPAISQEELEEMQDHGMDEYFQENFERIMQRKREAVQTHRLNQEDEMTALISELKERLEEQNTQ